MIDTNSSACVACHGDDLTKVLPADTYPDYPAAEHKGCSCHAYFEAGQNEGNLPAGQVGCQNCHATAHYSAHGFGTGFTASGHNTTYFGIIGAKEEFNGSEGVTLHSINVTSSAVATLETEWQFPTHAVFWGDPGTHGHVDTTATAWINAWNAANPTTHTTYESLDKDSVITCQDCHTGLNASGPHGAAQNWGIDPAYPGDYNEAELTKWIVTNPSGIKVRAVDDFFTLNTSSGMIATDPVNYAMNGTAPYYSGMPTTSVSVNADGKNHAIICSKCHQLEVPGDGYRSERTPQAELWMGNGSNGTTPGVPTNTNTGYINTAAVGGSNVPHGNAHFDAAGGQAQCVDCHIAIPHGWKRPRLLVNSGPYPAATGGGKNSIFDPVKDPYPYLSAHQHGTVDNGSATPGTLYSAWGLYPTMTGAPRGMESLAGTEGHELVASAWGTNLEFGGDGSGILTGPYTDYWTGLPLVSGVSTVCVNPHGYRGTASGGKATAIAGYSLDTNQNLLSTPAHNTNYVEWKEMQCEGCNHNAAHETGMAAAITGSVSAQTAGSYTETIRVKE
jgi:hypothetical protein